MSAGAEEFINEWIKCEVVDEPFRYDTSDKDVQYAIDACMDDACRDGITVSAFEEAISALFGDTTRFRAYIRDTIAHARIGATVWDGILSSDK